MVLRIVVLALLLQCVCSQRLYTVKNGQPSFCTTPCPEFTLVPSNSTVYETRQYGPETWVSKDIFDQPLDPNTKRALFRPLDRYIKKKKIPISSPILLKSYMRKNKFTMMMYVPKSYTKPLEDRRTIYVDPKPKFTVYVRSFSGNPNSNQKWLYEANILKKALMKDKKRVKPDAFYAAIYDRPWLTWTQHNELWSVAVE